MSRMDVKAADGVYGGLAQDDSIDMGVTDREAAQMLP